MKKSVKSQPTIPEPVNLIRQLADRLAHSIVDDSSGYIE